MPIIARSEPRARKPSARGPLEIPPPHPLEPIAVKALRSSEVFQSSDDLAPFLTAPGKPVRRFHCSIAAEILDRMGDRLVAWRNDQGQWRLFEPGDLEQTLSRGFRPTLAEELEARHSCRIGLVGLAVAVEGASHGRIVSTRWGPNDDLVVKIDDDVEGTIIVGPAQCRLVDAWPVTCCRPSKSKGASKVGG